MLRLPLARSSLADWLDVFDYLSQDCLQAVPMFSVIFPTNMYRYRKIGLILVFSGGCTDYIGTGGYPRMEIIHHQGGENLLLDSSIFTGMKINHAIRVFEVSEGSLYTPTKIVEFLNLGSRKRTSI